ncbi:MAG: DNA-processing protein DprA [Brevirhabdus sp.]
MTQDLFPSAQITAPQSEDEAVRWLQLIRSHRVGPSTFYRLLREHGSAGQALLALPEVARAAGVKGYRACDPLTAEREYRAGRKLGARLLCYGGPGYPMALAEIDDAPPVMWSIGCIGLMERPMIALVGARNASSLGTRISRKLAEDLGQSDQVIVSGLARGIDTAAHSAALSTGTVAVVAGGVDVTYPAENGALAAQIADTGVILSEQPLGLAPQARHFPPRNRIISGLARGVVVIEAAAKSGSLITARNALDQGREVMAVPGHPFDGRSGGCNMLIRDGAVLVRSGEDVLAHLGPAGSPERSVSATIAPPQPPEPPWPRELEPRILSLLGPNPLAEDQLIRDLQLPADAVAPTLVELELNGRIRRQPGGLLSLTV